MSAFGLFSGPMSYRSAGCQLVAGQPSGYFRFQLLGYIALRRFVILARSEGFEPPTPRFEVGCYSISQPFFPQLKTLEITKNLLRLGGRCTAVKCPESFTTVRGVTL